MTGFEPRLQPNDQARSLEEPGGHREALARKDELAREREAAKTVGTWAAQQAYKLGAEQECARLRDPQTGYDLGYDVAYSANLDDRAYVHAVMRGFEHGTQTRHGLTERLLEQSRPQPKPQPQTQPELEAEAG
jgi:hypothetical protein